MLSDASQPSAPTFKFTLPKTVAQGALPATPGEFRSLLSNLSTQADTQLQSCLSAQREQLTVQFEAQVRDQVATEVARQVQALLEQMRLARHQRFGAHSEANLLQGKLFNEAELEADRPDPTAAEPEADLTQTHGAAPSCQPRGRRHPLPPELPRVDVVVDVPEAHRPCSECGTPLVKIGEAVSEQLNIIPMRIEVVAPCVRVTPAPKAIRRRSWPRCR